MTAGTSGREAYLTLPYNDRLAFIAYAVPVIRPGTAFQHAWFIDALCQQLHDVTRARTLRLIVNMPPRSLKSTVVSVIFAAWWLGHNPSSRIICASHSDGLSKALADDFRRLVSDPTFTDVFPGFRIDANKNSATEVRTTRNGFRLATSVGGTLTGRGADLIIVDDPLNAVNAYSATERERVNAWFDTALLSRFDNKDHGAIIVVMQRLHEADLTGYLLEKGGWQDLVLPARNLDGVRSFPLLAGRSHDWPADADLMPRRLNRKHQDDLLADMSEAAYSAQYNQRPIPIGGAIFKRDWIRDYADAPQRHEFRLIVHSWDVATKPGQASDFSVCTIWGMTHRGDYYLLDLRRVRLDYPSILKLARQCIAEVPPTHLLIEDASNDTPLYQELVAGYGYAAQLIRAVHDKETRAHAATPAFEAGRVYLPANAAWRNAYLDELLGFPGSRHDDQVDSTTQFIIWAEERWRVASCNPMPCSTETEEHWPR